MIRDKRMQMLVAAHLEPITPFLFKVSVASVLMREFHRQTDTRRSLGGSLQVRDIYESAGVSSIVVIGGCGDYFDVADIVISLEAYLPSEVTERAKAIAAEVPSSLGDLEALKMTRPRCVRPPVPNPPPAPLGAPLTLCACSLVTLGSHHEGSLSLFLGRRLLTHSTDAYTATSL